MRLVTVVGARPQFVKAGAVSRALATHPDRWPIDETIIHTGQHYDEAMAGRFFAELGIPEPACDLEVGSGPHGAQTGQMMERLERVLIEDLDADAVLVYGDTNSTLAAALVASKLHLPIVHVEAGLRSGDLRMPEEVNRRLTDHVASLLACPSDHAAANLGSEGIAQGVVVTGDVMYDALLWVLEKTPATGVAELLGLEPGRYVIATIHRAENTDDPDRLGAILDGLATVVSGGLRVVLPLHPRTAAALAGRELPESIDVIEPLGHRDLLELAEGAAVGVTDSGGLQKELYWLATPCVTVRAQTEWVETVELGWNLLVDADPSEIVHGVEKMTGVSQERPDVYGSGDAAERILDAVTGWWAER